MYVKDESPKMSCLDFYILIILCKYRWEAEREQVNKAKMELRRNSGSLYKKSGNWKIPIDVFSSKKHAKSLSFGKRG